MRTTHTRKHSAALTAATVPLLLAACINIPPLCAQDYPQPNDPQQQNPAGQQADPPSLVARIGNITGDVSFMPSGSTDWAAGVDNYPMTSGDRLFCDQGAQAEIGTGSTDIRIWQNSDVTLTNLTDQFEQIGLASGSIRVRVYTMNPGASVEVDTPNGTAIINQPGDYRFDVFSGNGGSDAVVNAGTLQITGPNGLNQEVMGGQAVQMTGSNPIALFPVSLPAFDALDLWSIDLDHAVLNSQTAQYVSRETPGYADLDNNGNWASTPDYGPVWYPTTVAAGWSPYSAGTWAYVAPWGYTWIDAAPWGYTPFHYGRWVVIGTRWGWLPGPRTFAPVYSPAVVGWVGGGGGIGVSAWFPLGPAEPFVPWYHASPYYARQVNVTNVNVTVIHNTTVVNNYNTYITNTRTVSNINQIQTAHIQYANQAHVTAVPQSAMSSGRPIAQSAVRLTPTMQQQLAAAPVHYAPSAPAPARPLLPAKTNVSARPVAPTLVTPHGVAPATPAANPARLAATNLPAPRPAVSLPRPAIGAVAGRPATAQPEAAKAVMNSSAPQYPARPSYTPANTYSAPPQQRPQPSSPPHSAPAPKPPKQSASKEQKPN